MKGIFFFCKVEEKMAERQSGRRKYSENAEWQRAKIIIKLCRDSVGGQTHYKCAQISHPLMPEMKVITTLRYLSTGVMIWTCCNLPSAELYSTLAVSHTLPSCFRLPELVNTTGGNELHLMCYCIFTHALARRDNTKQIRCWNYQHGKQMQIYKYKYNKYNFVGFF